MRAAGRYGPSRPAGTEEATAATAPPAVFGGPGGMSLPDLQGSAGNRAVAGLVAGGGQLLVRRWPDPSPGTEAGAEAIEQNLQAAARDVADHAWIDLQVSSARSGAGTARSDAPVASPAVLLERAWRLPATEADVPQGLRARYRDIRRRLVAELARAHRPLWQGVESELAQEPARSGLARIVEQMHGAAPSFDVFGTAVDLWEHWLRLCPPESLGQEGDASRLRQPLRTALAGLVERWADTFSGTPHDGHRRPADVTPQADPSPTEIGAVAAALRGRTTWAGAADMADLTASVATALGRPPAEVSPVLARWVIHAECVLIGEAGLHRPSPAVWAYARSVYMSTLDEPVWRYYQENIQPFQLFGRAIWGKGAGVHRVVLPMLRLVDQEAVRLAGVADVAALAFQPEEWGGFRFEPQKADLARKNHVSFHATGMAIDFRVRTNDAVTGRTSNLLDAVAQAGGSAHTTESISHETPRSAQQTSWSQEVMRHLQRRDELRAQVEQARRQAQPPAEGQAPGPDAAVAGLESDLAREEAWLRDVGQQERAGELRDTGETVRQHLEAVEDGLRRAFQQFFPAPAGEEAAAQSPAARRAARTQQLTQGWPALRQHILDTLPPDAAPRFGRSFPERPAPVDLLRSLDHVADVGLTDQPPWMVQAFSSLGWRWGGGWHDPVDAMHFDFMGEVPGVHH